jgi:phosphate transport system protein
VLKSLEAFVNRDDDLANETMGSDDAVDEMRNSIVNDLIAVMKKDPESIPHSLDLLIIARHLERIADHATYIAADVIFLVKGTDVRHAVAEVTAEA